MKTMKRCDVEVFIGEDNGRTYVEARLRTELGDRLTGVGCARVAPSDQDVPEIGDELAIGRALIDLGRRLLDTASADIGAVTRQEVHLTR